VRDLVPKEGAVDPEHGFAMRYDLIEKNEKHVDAIAKAAKGADDIYLATDPDREGEAISWHIAEILKERDLLKDKPMQRVVFTEITPRAIKEAMTSRAPSPATWSMRSRRAARSTTWSASTCRRCCGARSSAACPPAACRARRCA
jgi:DNA topoisomerase IA